MTLWWGGADLLSFCCLSANCSDTLKYFQTYSPECQPISLKHCVLLGLIVCYIQLEHTGDVSLFKSILVSLKKKKNKLYTMVLCYSVLPL